MMAEEEAAAAPKYELARAEFWLSRCRAATTEAVG